MTTSYGRRLTDLARHHPDRPAVMVAGVDGTMSTITWRSLDERSNQVARLLEDAGVTGTSMVAVALPSSIAHVVTQFATWKLGGCVLPLPPGLPVWERRRVLRLARPKVVAAGWDADENVPTIPDILSRASDLDAGPLPDQVPSPARALLSGGSTGLPKLIVLRQPGVTTVSPTEKAVMEHMATGADGLPSREPTGGGPGQSQPSASRLEAPYGIGLIPGPLYHSAPFTVGHGWLLAGTTVVLMEKFDARRALSLIESLRVTLLLSVPTMLARMARVPDVDTTDLSSLEVVTVGAAACPEWLVRRWIDLVGPTRLVQAYGAAERQGFTQIAGDEWLERPRSVGRGVATDIRILDSGLREVPPGTVGEIYLRPQPPRPTYAYIGQEPLPVTPDGFVATGDLGWVDADGYLYLADRVRDEIKSGGATVYPAEVEAVLTEHPDVVDAAVVGLPDRDWGQRVHAIVQLAPPATCSPTDLIAWCRSRLSAFKVPKAIEIVDRLPRTEAGKLNRSALAAQRAPAADLPAGDLPAGDLPASDVPGDGTAPR